MGLLCGLRRNPGLLRRLRRLKIPILFCASPHRFTSSEPVHDAVTRVVQALSEVFADPELDHFLNNLNDTEMNELLIDPGKLTEVCDTALWKYTEEVFRARESFGLRQARLVEIVR